MKAKTSPITRKILRRPHFIMHLSESAAAIGGTSLAGGKGSIIGTFLGAILLQALKVGLVVCGVDTFWQYIATGLIIVFAVYVDVIQGKLSAMRLNKKAKA